MMAADAPNKLHRRLCQELAKQLSEHRVLLVFDPGQKLRQIPPRGPGDEADNAEGEGEGKNPPGEVEEKIHAPDFGDHG